jgi:hypothetical protein
MLMALRHAKGNNNNKANSHLTMHGLMISPVRCLLDNLDGSEQACVMALMRDHTQQITRQEPLRK